MKLTGKMRGGVRNLVITKPGLIPILAWFLAFMFTQSVTRSLSAQEPVRVSGEVSCAECVITLDTVVTIGGLDGPGLHAITFWSRVTVDRRDRILITDAGPEVSVFDAAGGFIRSVGRFGEGPGEYESISHINVGPRYIHVFDYHRGRTVLEHDFEVVRTDRFPGQVLYSVVMESEDVVFMGDVATPTSVGHKLHVLGLSGDLESFGGDGSSVYMGPSASHLFALTGNAEALWAVHPEPNRITRWDLVPGIAVGEVFDRAVEVYDRGSTPAFSTSGRTVTGWPRSVNGEAMLDDAGLWIVWVAPDPEWTERTVDQEGAMPPAPWHRIFDGWLDLVDPATGKTLARHRNDGVLRGFAQGSRYVVAYHETEAGTPYFHLLEPKLSQAPAGRR